MSKAKPARTLRPRHAAFRTSAGGLRLIASDRPFTLASGGAGAGLWCAHPRLTICKPAHISARSRHSRGVNPRRHMQASA